MMTVESQQLQQTMVAQTNPKRSWSPAFLMLCLAFVFVRLPFIFTVPMNEAPDEFAHYWVIKFVSEHMRLPDAAEVAAGGPSGVYGSLPQLGYIPHLLIASFTPRVELPLYERFGSLFMGLVLLYAAYHIARELFPKQRWLQFAVPAAIVFHPQLAFLHAYANNDSTSSALSAMLLLLMLRSIRTGVELGRSVVIGVLLGWLALSKYSGLAVMPVIVAGLIAGAAINKTSLAKTLTSAAGCIAAFSAACGWWFLRNFHEFAGDILGTQTMYKSWALTFHRDLNYHVPASHIIKELRWWRMMFFSFWGMFGYMTRYLWRPVYIAYVGFLIAAVVGLVRGTVAYARNVLAAGGAGAAPTPIETSPKSVDWRQTAGWTCMFAVVVINLAAMIWASTGNLGGPQGRYLFTSEVPVIALLIAGLNKLSAKHGAKLVALFLLFNASVCVGSWFMLFRMYGFHIRPL